ncbi:MAG: S-layer homology domain-containing protein [Thermodesulfobacteriota bacterium]
MKKRVGPLYLLAGLILIAVAGCAGPEVRCPSPEDNPAHHYLVGMQLLEDADLAGARAKFARSVFCDKGFAPSYGGLAITDAAAAVKSGSPPDAKLVAKSHAELQKARKLSKLPEEKFAFRLARMRVNSALRPEKWLKEVERDYKKAMRLKVDEKRLRYYHDSEAASYFMGLAYIEGGRYQSAAERFNDVLRAGPGGKWNGPADKGWKRADRVVRALGGMTVGDVGRLLAVNRVVTRAALAAFLYDELKIDRLFSARVPVKKREGRGAFSPVDIANSPFKEELLAVMKWGIRGLEPVYDPSSKAYLFRPGSVVSRKDFAFVVEDILMKITGDDKLATAFVGHRKSPFPDVATTAPWYNAVMNAATRNIMETSLSGEFRPDEPLDGPDLILAVRVLSHHLNIP